MLASLEMTVQEREEFLAEPHIAVLNVGRGSDRPPFAVPVWYHSDPGVNVSFFTSSQGRVADKTKLIERAGVVSLTVQQETQPCKYVTVEGTVVSIEPPSGESMFAIVGRYLPEGFANGFVDMEIGSPDSKLTLFVVQPTRWLTSDFGKLHQ